MSLPTTMNAVVIEGQEAVIKSGLPLPPMSKDTILIKNKAVAGNPTDWKHIAFKLGPQGAILGCDVVGEIVKLGENVDPTEFQIGDYVYGITHGASVKHPENGAFAEYSVLDKQVLYKAPKTMKFYDGDNVPEGSVTTFEGAATLPVSLTTAGAILYHEFGLKLDWECKTPQNNFPILLWGGATAVGQLLIQLAKKLNGYTKIIVVASKKNEEKLKRYGADEVFDYHDTDVIEQITKKYDNFEHLVDCVSIPTTTQQVYACAAKGKPATVLQLTTGSIETIKEDNRRDDVKVADTMLYKFGGEDIPFGRFILPADPKYREDVIEFMKFINPKILSGEIYHIPVKKYKGLEGVVQLTNDIKEGKNFNEKLVSVL